VDANGDLIEFAFESQMASGLEPEALLRLARQCWTWNTRMGVTGELCLKGDRFIQVIEGPCRIVQPLAARILTDTRHGLIRIDRFGLLAARRFGGWSLRGMAVREARPEPVPAVWGANVRALPTAGRRIPPADLPRVAGGSL
jgi:hypothetical protein